MRGAASQCGSGRILVAIAASGLVVVAPAISVCGLLNPWPAAGQLLTFSGAQRWNNNGCLPLLTVSAVVPPS